MSSWKSSGSEDNMLCLFSTLASIMKLRKSGKLNYIAPVFDLSVKAYQLRSISNL